MVAKFGLNRLGRSPSSLPNPFGGFHHHACMQACRFKATRSPAHFHCSIVHIRLVHNVLNTILNVLAQRSHKLRNRFHTAHSGTILVPNSEIPNGCSILHQKTCEFLSLMPPVHLLQNQICWACSPRTPRRCIHSQLLLRSIFCRPGWMLRQFLSTCKLPLQSYANKRSPGSTGGAETQVTHQQFTHAQQSTTSKTLWRERMNYNPKQADTALNPN